MSVQRRGFLKAGVATSMLSMVPRSGRPGGAFAPQSGPWRWFELRTRIDIKESECATHALIPRPFC